MDSQTNSRWALSLLLIVSIMAGAGCVFRAVHAGTENEAAAAARSAYNEKTAATYNNRFGVGVGTHFLPSLATTDNGEFMDPSSFPTAQYCGHCHQEAHTQWRQSAHANSNRPQWYLRNVALLDKSKGVEYSRHCEGCHDPIALVSGALTEKGPRAQVVRRRRHYLQRLPLHSEGGHARHRKLRARHACGAGR